MDQIREGMELTNEISDAISNPMNVGIENDEEDLKAQLAELEAEKLDEVLMGADRVPSHVPSAPGMAVECTFSLAAPCGRNILTPWPLCALFLLFLLAAKKYEQESEEDRELRELQASLAM